MGDAERITMRLKVEVMHPSWRKTMETRLLFFKWDIELVSAVSDSLIVNSATILEGTQISRSVVVDY